MLGIVSTVGLDNARLCTDQATEESPDSSLEQQEVDKKKEGNFDIKAWSRWHTPVSVYVILCHYLTLHYDTEI